MAATTNGAPRLLADAEPEEAVLTLPEQVDGRKVARLPGGKVVLVDKPIFFLEDHREALRRDDREPS